MAGLPAPEVCWVIVVRGISARRMTTIPPIAAMMIGGFVHHLAIRRAFLFILSNSLQSAFIRHRRGYYKQNLAYLPPPSLLILVI
jgi:hypothetical protein